MPTLKKEEVTAKDVEIVSQIEASNVSGKLVEYGLSMLEGYSQEEKRLVEAQIRESLRGILRAAAGIECTIDCCANCDWRMHDKVLASFRQLSCTKGVKSTERGVDFKFKCIHYRAEEE